MLTGTQIAMTRRVVDKVKQLKVRLEEIRRIRIEVVEPKDK